jgi:ATP-dependent RNA helicase DDX31/DBP7
LRKKAPAKAKTEISSAPSASSEFKLIDEQSPSNPSKKRKKKEKSPDISIEELLSKDVKDVVLPKPLPVVDFSDDDSKKSKKKKKNKNANTEMRDYVKEAQKMPEPPKERKKIPKVKFSKVSNPFPNDPSKKVQKQDSKQQKGESKKDAGSPSKPSSSFSSAEEVQSENSNVFTVESVDSLKIHPHSIKNMKEVLNFHKLTHVQQKSLPPALDGKDLLIRSATGSGKTLTYALPIVERLHSIQPKLNRSQGIHALVIVPTRELCIQTYELFVKLVKPFTWLVPGYLSGGEKRKTEKARLRNGITILISTPGRLCDHLMHTESLKLDKIEVFVLDEADRLLELGYENDVKKVVDTISEHSKNGNRDIQKILLSATLTAKVKQLAGLTLESPVCVDNENVDTIKDMLQNSDLDETITIPTGIEQKYLMVPPKLRFIVLCSLLVQQMAHGARKILIFFPTQHVVDYHYDILVEFLTQPFTKKPKTAQSYLKHADESDEDIDEMLNAQDESDDEDEGNIWLPHVTLFKYNF